MMPELKSLSFSGKHVDKPARQGVWKDNNNTILSDPGKSHVQSQTLVPGNGSSESRHYQDPGFAYR